MSELEIYDDSDRRIAIANTTAKTRTVDDIVLAAKVKKWMGLERTEASEMNTPVRVGETIEGSRTMRNRPYQVLKCSSWALCVVHALRAGRGLPVGLLP